MFMGTPYLTSKELAERWKLTVETLKKWRIAGKGPPHRKLGGRILYKFEEIQKIEDAAIRYHTSMPSSPFEIYIGKEEVKMT